jgi:hypothetical protein
MSSGELLDSNILNPFTPYIPETEKKKASKELVHYKDIGWGHRD